MVAQVNGLTTWPKATTAAATLVAFTGDLFFPPEDISADVDRVPGAKYVETGAIDQIYAEALAG